MSQFDELPEGWKLISIKDIADYVQRGKQPKYIGYSELPVINQKCIRWHTIQAEHLKFIHPEQWDKWQEERFLKIGDILWNSTGTGTVGRAAIYERLEKFSRAVVDSHVTIIRLKESNPRYLHYWIMSPTVQSKIESMHNGSTNQVELSRTEVVNTQVPLPPLNEQRRIVEKIEALTARSRQAREALEAIPELLDQFRQSVLAAAFRGDLTADWRAQNPDVETAEALLERIRVERMQLSISTRDRNRLKKDWEELEISNSNVVPDTWLKCSIGHIGNVCNGSTPSRKESTYWDGSISWVSSGEVQNNIIATTREKITDAGFQNSSGRILPVGTVLLAMIGEGKTRGQTAILEIEATINQNIAAIILDHGLIASRYIWHWFRYQYSETRRVGSGSGPQALNCQRVREMPFILPPLAEQQVIVEQIDGLLALTGNIEGQHQNTKDDLDQLDRSILAKAFRGELVPQDPNDEPAAVLLDRIRAEREQLNSKSKSQKSKKRKQQ
ncbi:restriction endonuclease subunit S [Halomicronema sp. CCY15110]|uniref:restriction endonuclease subunit S n=1 Tax=Halomicronema sp. CCY15110 TaxID=2767773 RepID=UPI00194DEFBB|nr:restriction endonuclease subunit S [Halomicronema sp. CCY15110]